MVVQHLHAAHAAKGFDKIAHLPQLGFIVRQPGHQNVADPHGFAMFAHPARHIQNGGVIAASQGLVAVRVKGFQVQHHQVGVLHQGLKLGIERFRGGVGLAGGIQGGMHALQFGQAEQLRHKVDL